MPKAIEIYTTATPRALMVDVNHPKREDIFRFGWDIPKEIWEAMNDTVPAFICSRIRLVSADGTPIMSVEERTDAAIIDGLHAIEAESVQLGWFHPGAPGYQPPAEMAGPIDLYEQGRPLSTGWRG